MTMTALPHPFTPSERKFCKLKEWTTKIKEGKLKDCTRKMKEWTQKMKEWKMMPYLPRKKNTAYGILPPKTTMTEYPISAP